MKIQIYRYDNEVILIETTNKEIQDKLKILGYEIKKDNCFFNNKANDVMNFIFDRSYNILEFYFLNENIEVLNK